MAIRKPSGNHGDVIGVVVATFERRRQLCRCLNAPFPAGNPSMASLRDLNIRHVRTPEETAGSFRREASVGTTPMADPLRRRCAISGKTADGKTAGYGTGVSGSVGCFGTYSSAATPCWTTAEQRQITCHCGNCKAWPALMTLCRQPFVSPVYLPMPVVANAVDRLFFHNPYFQLSARK